MATLAHATAPRKGSRPRTRTAQADAKPTEAVPVPRLQLFDFDCCFGPQQMVVVDYPAGTRPDAISRQQHAAAVGLALVELLKLTRGSLRETVATLLVPRRAGREWVWVYAEKADVGDALDEFPCVE